jgi:hypothetical protein
MVGDIFVAAFKLTYLLDILQLKRYKWTGPVSLSVNKRQDIVTVFLAIFTGWPTCRLREEHHCNEEESRADYLKTSWDAERGGAAVGRKLIANE